MKKVLHINLGSYPFTIDIDAYDLLDNYFLSLEKHFTKNENPDEIIFDIESRMAELFHENVGEKSILTIKDIEEAIKVMGKPEDFGDEEAQSDGDEATGEKKENGRKKHKFQTGKKLYRDPENKVIAGVCSGLSAYFGIGDPIWLRLLAAVLFFTGGLSVVPYIILMVVIPKAKTSADRRAMYGEPIDIDTVAESVEEEITALSEQFQDWARSFRDKRRNRKFRRKRRF